MDIDGRHPTSEVGKYFRRNVWGWHPLAEYCTKRFPAVTAACRDWHSNDGDGLNATQSKKLAEWIESDLADGMAEAYVKTRDASLADLPNETCEFCKGTGVRADAVGVKESFHVRVINEDNHPRRGKTGWCNGCNGRGWSRPIDAWYFLRVKDLEEWAAFLHACGGFKIN